MPHLLRPPQRCDICGIERGEYQRREPVVILHFQLLYYQKRIDAPARQRGAGTIDLCRVCWEQLGRIHPRPRKRRDVAA